MKCFQAFKNKTHPIPNAFLFFPPKCCDITTQNHIHACIALIFPSLHAQLQHSSACCVQNLAAVSTGVRRQLVSAGAVKGLERVLARTESPQAAIAACGAVQNFSIEVRFMSAYV